ncbi:hypothetical protein CCR75_005112 [Bremia lactucae]|uniref:Anaphase-promoting complex subunit 7 n=1 Tax=Bremia lactucae TaxID=4779 RepID=A0A976IDW5_BRELC|nr:hypothetical protein CCR75_005112 [Bremia lactucae]
METSKKRRANKLQRCRDESDTADANTRMATQYNAKIMQQQMESFISSGNIESAQILGELLVSIALFPLYFGAPDSKSDTENKADTSVCKRRHDDSCTAPGNAKQRSPAFHAKTLHLFADLMVTKREYKRAIRYYHHSCRDRSVVTKEQELEVKLKIAKCYVEINCIHEAIAVLRSTSLDDRSLSMNLLLGKLYVAEGLQIEAEKSYMAALRQNSYALEAALALAKIATAKGSSPDAFEAFDVPRKAGEDAELLSSAICHDEIERYYSAFQKTTDTGFTHENAMWMQTLVTASMDAEQDNHQGMTSVTCFLKMPDFNTLCAAIESYNTLDEIFPRNLYCILRKGSLELKQDLLHQANVTFKRARQVDEFNLTYMDRYANCLRKGKSQNNLNDLVHELFQISSTCAESWLAAAYYNDMKGDYEAALKFSERAIADRQCHVPAHLFRGEVLLRLNRPKPALKAFWTACRLTPSLEAYTGIITSYCELDALGVHRSKEAIATAKTAVKLFPQKAQSFVLLGNALALSTEHREQAHQALHKALSIEPRNISNNFALVDLLVEDGNLRDAIKRLEALGERHPREEVFTKLAYTYSMEKQYPEALNYFHQALRLNPGSSEAVQGLDRLEKLMHGEDPDEMNNSMEQMGQQEHEESMEANEYLSS